MNKSRREWSSIYKCFKGKRDSLTAFYSLASAIFTIAIVFYCAVYYVGMKYPDVPLTLDANDIAQNAGPSRSGGRNEQRPRASSATRSANRPVKPVMSINAEDSDEEILIAEPLRPQTSPLITIN